MYIANELSRTRGTYKLEDCNFSGNSMASTFSTSGKYTDKVQVYQGKVIYKGNNVSEKNWADEVGVPVYETFPTDGTTKDGLTYSKGTLSGSYTGTAQNIIIPDGVTSINSAVFSSKKTSIKNILLPNTVTKITAASFMGWSSLKSLIIPESVTELGAVFLSGCSNVEYIRIPKTVTTIQTCTFSGSSLKKIVVENGSPFKEEDKDQFLNGGPNGWGQPSDCEVIFE